MAPAVKASSKSRLGEPAEGALTAASHECSIQTTVA
jgi:hypothetical protein